MRKAKAWSLFLLALAPLAGAVYLQFSPPGFALVQVATRRVETSHDVANRMGNDNANLQKLMPYRDGLWGPLKLKENERYRVVADVNSRKNPDEGFTVNARLSLLIRVAALTGEAVPVSVRGGVARHGRAHRFTQAEFRAPRSGDFMLYVDATGASEVEEMAQVRLMRVNTTILTGLGVVMGFFALGLLIGGIVVLFGKD